MNKQKNSPFRTPLIVLLITFFLLSLSGCSADVFDSFFSSFGHQNAYLNQLARSQEPVQQPATQISATLSPVSYEDRFGYNAIDDSQKTIYDAINTAVLNYYRFVDLRKNPIPINDFLRVFYHYIDDHPEVFWVNPHIENFFYNSSDEQCIGVILQYHDKNGTENYDSEQNEILQRIPDDRLTEMRDEFNKEINQILNLLSVNDDDLQRELKIFDYIAATVTYDHDLADNIINNNAVRSISQSAFGAAIEHQTVCTGYAKLFSLLANSAGLECLSQYGVLEGVGHQWNVISIDGDYYHVDATDPVVTHEETTFIDYTYFNTTDEDIQKTHTLRPSFLTESNYQVSYDTPSCSAEASTFETLFGVTVSGGTFSQNDYQQKIERLSDYNRTGLYFYFPEGTTSNSVQRFFNNNASQMDRLASGYFTLEKYYYYFETTGKAYIKINPST